MHVDEHQDDVEDDMAYIDRFDADPGWVIDAEYVPENVGGMAGHPVQMLARHLRLKLRLALLFPHDGAPASGS